MADINNGGSGNPGADYITRYNAEFSSKISAGEIPAGRRNIEARQKPWKLSYE